MSSHKAEQWSIALQPRHKSANLAKLGAMVLPVKPLQGAAVGAWQLPRSPVYLYTPVIIAQSLRMAEQSESVMLIMRCQKKDTAKILIITA